MAGSQTNKNLKTLADKKAEQFKWVGLAEFAFRLFLDDLSSLLFLLLQHPFMLDRLNNLKAAKEFLSSKL